MTPITSNRAPLSRSDQADNPGELAMQPLRFTDDRQCINKDILAAVIDALSDQRSADQLVVTIIKNACQNNYQAEINQIIKNIHALHGRDGLCINQNIKLLLADQGLDLIEHDEQPLKIIGTSDLTSARQLAIRQCTQPLLPTALAELICSYDGDIRLSDCEPEEIMRILGSDDRPAKQRIIAAASEHNEISHLNTLLSQLRRNNIGINLSYLNLSNLDLTSINLHVADLSHANFSNSCLKGAVLSGARLVRANLNKADLTSAMLNQADLTGARCIAATLVRTIFRGARLIDVCLACAELIEVDLSTISIARDLVVQFAHTKDLIHTLGRLAFNVAVINAPIDVIFEALTSDSESTADGPLINLSPIHRSSVGCNTIAPTPHCERDGAMLLHPTTPVAVRDGLKLIPMASTADDPTRRAKSRTAQVLVVFTEGEKNLLRAKGILITSNRDGTFRLSKSIAVNRNAERHQAIESTLSPAVPKVLVELISDYDTDIQIGENNEAAILALLRSDDLLGKQQIFAAASRQQQITYLNRLIQVSTETVPLDLSHIDLSNLNLQTIHLYGVNLTGAVLHGCDLRRANLRLARLERANLNGAQLMEADLVQANLSDARLIGANLTMASLNGAKMPRAVLKFADLFDANLYAANLAGAWLDYANLTDTTVEWADLRTASLRHANMVATWLYRANLSHADLAHARLVRTGLGAANLSHADFSNATLDQVNFTASINMTGTIWSAASFSKIVADRTAMRRLPLRMWMYATAG